MEQSKATTDICEGVSISLTPAPFGKRLLAYLVDLSILTACFYGVMFLTLFVGLIFGVGLKPLIGNGANIVVALLFIVLIVGCLVALDSYFIYFEYKKGATPGKALFGLRTVSLSNNSPTIGQCAIRGLMRYIDCFLVLPGLISIILTKRSQRLGDLMSSTMVIYSEKKEKSVHSRYIDHHSYELLKPIIQPKLPPEPFADKLLQYAFHRFISSSGVINASGLDSEWRVQIEPFIGGSKEEQVDNEMIIRFFAEHCFIQKGLTK